MKCGFAGENFPTSVFPCVVGRPLLRYEESLMEQEIKVNTFHYILDTICTLSSPTLLKVKNFVCP